MIDSTSIGESFQRRIGSWARERNRASCSSSDTENQYFSSRIPSSTSIRSTSGACRRKRWYCCSVQNPMTFSTPARLYQERSMMTISPAAGRCCTYRWKYHWVFSRSVGAGSATIRVCRGFRYWVIRLIAEPFPAASRPSKMMMIRSPRSITHCCIATSSACRRLSSFS